MSGARPYGWFGEQPNQIAREAGYENIKYNDPHTMKAFNIEAGAAETLSGLIWLRAALSLAEGFSESITRTIWFQPLRACSSLAAQLG